MKIQTNAGEVELTVDMVRPGMVFQAPGWEPYTLHRQIVEFGDWVGSDGMAEKPEYLLDAEVRTFLGCAPAIAAREDVERYGVAPGIDAGAHGFARLPTGGALDLAKPENVRKGMLFRVQVNPEVYGTVTRDIVAACDGQFGVPASAGRFLGCHPEIARREDCERFGIPERVEQNGVQDGPIDAVAHGFARLRGGGAVDLRRAANIVAGMVFANEFGERYIAGRMVRDRAWARADTNGGSDRADLTQWLLTGLDARYARPEDVARLCCGVDHAYRVGEHAMGRDVCTLAIGDHEMHEDIAAGTKWPAKSKASGLVEASSQWTTASFAGRPFPTPSLYPDRVAGLRKALEEAPGDLMVPKRGTSKVVEPPPLIPFAAVRAWLVSRGYTVQPGAEDGYERFERADGHWMCLLADERPVEDENDVEFFAGEMKLRPGEVREGLLRAAAARGAVALLSWICGMDPEAKRRAAEAPLVALVAAVPKELDPIGWRAAVLALHEHHVEGYGGRSDERARAETIAVAGHLTVMLQQFAVALSRGMAVEDARRTATNGRCLAMTTAYYRVAIAPQGPRPSPERKIGGRAVRIVVDNGSDD